VHYTFHRTHHEIPEWNEVAAIGGLYSSSEWVSMFAPTWVAVRSEGTVLAVVPCVSATGSAMLPGLTEPDYLFTYDGNQAAVEVPVDEIYPVLFCGAARGYTCRLLIRDGLAPATRAAVVAHLVKAVRELGERQGAKLIIFGFLPSPDVEELLAIDGNLGAVFNEAECMLGPVESFDAYLASCRCKAKREISRFEAMGFRIERPRLRDVFDAVAEVVTEHERKFDPGVTLDAIRGFISPYLEPGLDERTRVFCAWQGETLFGASLSIAYGRTYHSRFGSVRADAPRAAAVQFNVAYYAPIRAAIDEGSTVHYGMNGVETKVVRGCRARSLWTVLDPRIAWSEGLRRRLRDMAKVRFDLTTPVLRKYQPEELVREELGLGTQLVSSIRIADS